MDNRKAVTLSLLSICMVCCYFACNNLQQTEQSEEINTSITEKHKQIAGSDLFLIFPENYRSVDSSENDHQDWIGLLKNDSTYLDVSELKGYAFEKQKEILFKTLSDEGRPFNQFQRFTLNGNEAYYLEAPFVFDETSTEFFLLTGDNEYVLFLRAMCGSNDFESIIELRSIIYSSYYER